ncbi:MAG: hypothetical protein AAFO95_17945, partial [Cyanobacteria bacterium J06600_6]
QQYQRLSQSEQQIIKVFAEIERPLSLREVAEKYRDQMRSSEIMECLQSLKRRSLLDRVNLQNVGSNQSSLNFYHIHPVVRKYIQSQS